MQKRNRIAGIGSYLPERILKNDELAEMVDTSDTWIQERTGIKQRHIVADGQTTSDLGYRAALSALENAGIDAQDIDLIIVATSTPDLTFPATATIIQEKLGITHGAAFDVQAVCSGFIYGINIMDAMMKAGNIKRAMLIGAETFSRILDWEDRGTCVLFGDGAGAVILEAQDLNANDMAGHDDAAGVLHSYIRSDGRYKDMLYVDGGPSSTQTVGCLRMQGNAVFKHAVTEIVNAMRDCAEQSGVNISDIDWFVPHQANQRILTAVARKLRISPDRVVSTVASHANTSAASVPLAMHAAIKDGRIKRGDLVMLEAFGGGFTWGAALLRY